MTDHRIVSHHLHIAAVDAEETSPAYRYYVSVDADQGPEHVFLIFRERRLAEGELFEHGGRSYRVLRAEFEPSPVEGLHHGSLVVERTDAL